MGDVILLLIIATLDEHYRNKATQIFEKYYSTMMYVANAILKDKSLSEDAVSESMIKIMRNLHKIENIDCYKTRRFIVVIVENTAKTIWQKRKNLAEDVDNTIENFSDNSNSDFEGLEINESVNLIIGAIRSLPKSISDVLYLSAVMGFSDMEIVDKLSISHSAVRMRLSRARATIKEILRSEVNGNK